MNSFPLYQRFPVLVTKRLRLRELRPTDAESIFSYKNRTDYVQFPYVKRHTDLLESQQFIRDSLQDYYKKIGICWGITIVPQDNIIGTVGLWVLERDAEIDHRAEIVCELSSDFHRQGIMTEARTAVINHVFSEWKGVNRIHSEVAATNVPSLQMNRKLGFVVEGTLRAFEKSDDGSYIDIHILGLLRSDWEKSLCKGYCMD